MIVALLLIGLLCVFISLGITQAYLDGTYSHRLHLLRSHHNLAHMMNGPSDYLPREEVGLACADFKNKTANDPFWDRANYEYIVRFWCSDLRIRHFYLKWSKRHFWKIEDPKGRRVITASSPTAAWRFAAAIVYYHLKKVRKEREDESKRTVKD